MDELKTIEFIYPTFITIKSRPTEKTTGELDIQIPLESEETRNFVYKLNLKYSFEYPKSA